MPSAFCDDEESEDSSQPWQSITSCFLTAGSTSSYSCEFAVFGSYPPTPLTAALADVGLGCDEFGEDVLGKVVLAKRGVCPFTTKAHNAQVAGAVGLIVGDSVEGTEPVRMKGTGEEAADWVLTVPAVMVGLESYEALLAGSGEVTLSTGIEKDDHPLVLERGLKALVAAHPEKAEHVMQLASYLVREDWKETGRQMLR